MEASHAYDDIINLPHPVSETRPRMTMTERAAQFAPFAALTGYGARIDETGRLTDEKLELDEEQKLALNETLNAVSRRLGSRPAVSVSWFVPDESKEGGRTESREGNARRVDSQRGTLTLTDGTVIPFENLYRLELREGPEE